MEGNILHGNFLQPSSSLLMVWGVRTEDNIWYEDSVSVSPTYDLLCENICSNLIKSHSLITPGIQKKIIANLLPQFLVMKWYLILISEWFDAEPEPLKDICVVFYFLFKYEDISW